MIVAGKQAEQQLTRAGEIDYFCRFHPFMTGKITVLAE
jgi:plastocyanin